MSDKIVIRNSYSHRVSTVKKSNGHSILRIIAYIMARKLENNLTGNEHNFSHKSGVINRGFFMPHGIKTEMNEEQFYNHIENNSHASTNIIAYSSILALPPELSQEEQIKVVEKFCEYFTEQYGTCISYAIHEADNLKKKKARLAEIEKYNLPEDADDLRLQIQNNHVHFVIPYCKIEALTEQDLKSKRKKKSHGDTFKIGSQVKDFNPIKWGSEIKKDKPDLMNIEQNFLQYMRQKPCELFNNALEKNGRIERYTHKSYKDLGLEISATTHEGEMVRSRVEQGKKMDVHEYNRQQKAKQQTESDYEQAQDLLNQINNAHQLIDNKLADHEHEPLDLREKLDKLKESNSNNAPGATPEPQETLSQKLELLKQKQTEQPKPTAEPKDDNDNEYSPF